MIIGSGASAVVSGGASGLGAASVRKLVEQGVKVFALDLESSIDKQRSAGALLDGVEYLPVDVTDGDAVVDAVATAQKSAPLRVAVACAGVCPSQRIVSSKGMHDFGLFASTINVNLVGSFHLLAAAAQQMAGNEPVDDDGQRGVMVLTSSVAAFEGQVGQAGYAASKGGVHSLALTAARDLASKGIRVNAIAPGIVDTPMMAGIAADFRAELESRVQFPRRLARPEEFAGMVSSFVASDYLNGETVRLDGGLRMPPR